MGHGPPWGPIYSICSIDSICSICSNTYTNIYTNVIDYKGGAAAKGRRPPCVIHTIGVYIGAYIGVYIGVCIAAYAAYAVYAAYAAYAVYGSPWGPMGPIFANMFVIIIYYNIPIIIYIL